MVPHSGLHELLRRITRRDVLRVSVGAGLSFLLPTLESRAAERRGAERPKSLITLWMAGGQSQLESWDPHPQSSQNGSEVKAIETTVSGLQIADTLPQMAEQALFPKSGEFIVRFAHEYRFSGIPLKP